eukprot:2649244-Ditylum_brightwellii.AAC.1
MHIVTNKFEIIISNHAVWERATNVINKKFDCTQDFIFIEGLQRVFQDKLCGLINKPKCALILPYGSASNIHNVIMEGATKVARFRKQTLEGQATMLSRLQNPSAVWKVSEKYDTTFGWMKLTKSEGWM